MRAVKAMNINNIFFIDIETAPQWESLKEAPQHVRDEWVQKNKYTDGAPLPPHPDHKDNPNSASLQEKYDNYFDQLYIKNAALMPEFSRVVCISGGYLSDGYFRLKSWYDADEGALLKRFADDLTKFNAINKYLKLCAHYGKGFDYPFLTKRLLIHRQDLPLLLDMVFVKPWENPNIDTHEIWRAGGIGSGGTLSSIAMAFGLPSPKSDIDGSQVGTAFYNGEIDRIVKYCELDVFTLLNVFKCVRGEEPLPVEMIQKVVL